MKTYTIYECEVCGAKSKNRAQIIACDKKRLSKSVCRKGEAVEVFIDGYEPALPKEALRKWVKGVVSKVMIQAHSHEPVYWITLSDFYNPYSSRRKKMKLIRVASRYVRRPKKKPRTR